MSAKRKQNETKTMKKDVVEMLELKNITFKIKQIDELNRVADAQRESM